jgi:hypothetical protein
LHQICGYELDVDGPYPKPVKPLAGDRPERMAYPKTDIRIKHYGKVIENMIQKALAMEEGNEKQKFIEVIANFMKQLYRNWNKSIINDEEVFNDLRKLSGGRIVISEGIVLDAVKDLPREKGEFNNRNKFKKKNFKRRIK